MARISKKAKEAEIEKIGKATKKGKEKHRGYNFSCKASYRNSKKSA